MERVWTIGHSTRSIEEFIGLLVPHSIRRLADVRQFPASRRYPHFNKDALATSLGEHGIEYLHFPELGGRRTARADSRNTAWRNSSFRGYANYMETFPFGAGITRLTEFAIENTAIMCAEALWWRCHRALISDYLKTNDIEVFHIIDQKKTELHPFTSAARVVNDKLTYRYH